MTLHLSATLVKSFFQYRCERQVRYGLLGAGELRRLGIAVPELVRPAWAQAGIDYEAELLAALQRSGENVLVPAAGESQLSDDETASFLRRAAPHVFAYQALLRVDSGGDFHRRWQLPAAVTLSRAFPDLIQALLHEGRTVAFRLIDIKAVREPTPFHKAQVAFYSLLLDSLLRQMRLGLGVDPFAEIWHPGPDHPLSLAEARTQGLSELQWQRTRFRLKGYQAQVADFLRRQLGPITAARIDGERDDTFFHLYFKCEQCHYLAHCQKTIADDLPAAQWDVSAVPGLTQTSKRVLLDLGIRTVGTLAGVERFDQPGATWALRTDGKRLIARAGALLDGQVHRFPDRRSHLMPACVDVGLYLLVDRDPIEGRLATVGCLCERPEGREFTIEVIRSRGPEPERHALLTVLSRLFAHLDAVDRANAAGARSLAHIFLYETSEGRDLQQALGRHLADGDIRGRLLDLLRMFPPEELLPEPEYAGAQHLPATFLQGVLNQLYAIPARVAYDLRSVSAAFARATPPLAEVYAPGEPFRRPFSSRLNIACCRALKEGSLPAAAVEADVRARLGTLATLTHWVLADNARAPQPFLCLKKAPFRFQRRFDPLDGGDLDLLRTQELLAERTQELETLGRLAAPAEERRQRFACFAGMTLVSQGPSPAPWAARRLVFHAPLDCRQCELRPGSRGVILTDGNHDLLLEPRLWPQLFVSLDDVQPETAGVRVVIDVRRKVWEGNLMKRLVRTTPAGGWYLDQAREDVTGPWMDAFLRYLGNEEAG